jgi:hypothetical protein
MVKKLKLMMKLKQTMTAAAVGLAFAAPSQAALVGANNNTTGSSLFLVAWSSAGTYIRDLGLKLSDVLRLGTPGNTDTALGPNSAWISESGFTFTHAGDALFNSVFGGNITSVRWSITAGENISSPYPTSLVSTFVPGVKTAFNTGVVSNGAGQVGIMANIANNPTPGFAWSTGSCAAQASCATLDGGALGGGAQWGERLGGKLPTGNNTAGLGAQAVDFWYARGDGPGTLSPATHFQFANSMFQGKWTLAADGTASYNLPVIPLPGAVWLLASGLIGLGVVARRRDRA